MQNDDPDKSPGIPHAPRGLSILLAMGPGLVWCGEYIGSGEVILATRSGAIFGVALLWVPVLAIFSKYWIGLAGAHYTVTTGEGMIDMLSRTPGPRNWVLWPVFLGQICSGAISTAALASVTGVFAHYFIPLPEFVLGWLAVLFVIALVWSGVFEPIKHAMTLLVTLIILGTLAVVVRTWPGWGEILHGLFGMQVPPPAPWYQSGSPGTTSTWFEILPLLGWAAGGFASQVWYSYWVIGAGYGMTKDRGYGQPLDAARLSQLTADEATRIKSWRRVVTADATLALVIGTAVTSAFMIAGASVLGPAHLAPEGASVAIELSRLFGDQWGQWGAHLFVLAGLAAMLSTMVGQFAGWPRLLADCARILLPGTARWPWKTQFRGILLLLAITNMGIVYSFGMKPVFLVKISAILDGMVMTPLQALAVGLTLFFVMPKLLSEEARPILRAHKALAGGLLLAFTLFSYFCLADFIH